MKADAVKRCGRLLQKFLTPTSVILLLLIPASALTLAVVFTGGLEATALAYVAYGISAYTTAAAVLRVYRLAKRGKALLHKNPFLHKYLTEMDYRAEISLYLSLGINIFYALYKAAAGIYLHSVWSGTLAFYYMVLSTVRFLLLHSVRGKERRLLQEYRKYRFCGYMLLVLTVAITGIGICTIASEKAVNYPGYTIYAAAGYTFYNAGAAIANILRYRKLKNPLYTASKVIALATALVSIFFLQTAMFAAFGDGAAWQKPMNIGTGAGVFVLVAVLSLLMIRHGSRSIAALTSGSLQTDMPA